MKDSAVMYRTVIEMSCMINNDEWVLYTDKEVTEVEEALTKLDYFVTGFDDPKIRFSRPIFNTEFTEGLVLYYKAATITTEEAWYALRAEEEGNLPELTLLLDSYFKMKKWFNFRSEYCDGTISSWIANYVGSNYYDCMSGGMSKYDISIIKYFCETQDINMQEEVYPRLSEDKWYTLEDFVNSTTAPDFQELLNKYRSSLEAAALKLLENW